MQLLSRCASLAWIPIVCGNVAIAQSNLIFIVSDDQEYNGLGLLNPEIQMPNLHRLADEGVYLTQFYLTCPACTPSRGSLLTGRYPQRNGILDMIRNEVPDYGFRYCTSEEHDVTFECFGGMNTRKVLPPQILKLTKCQAGICGKWDLGSLKRFLPLACGLDDLTVLSILGSIITHTNVTERIACIETMSGRKLIVESMRQPCSNVRPWVFSRIHHPRFHSFSTFHLMRRTIRPRSIQSFEG